MEEKEAEELAGSALSHWVEKGWLLNSPAARTLVEPELFQWLRWRNADLTDAMIVLMAASKGRGPLARLSFCFLRDGILVGQPRQSRGKFNGKDEPGRPGHSPFTHEGNLKYGFGIAAYEGCQEVLTYWQKTLCNWNCFDCFLGRYLFREADRERTRS